MITAGKLLGWGGLSAVSYDYDVTNSGKTTVTAIHPLNPDPEHRAVVQVADGPVTLSWDNYVDPNGPGETVTADVWFGTDPNKLGGNYSKIVNAADVTGVARSSSAPQAIAADTTYYWQVDFDNGSGSIIEGPVFEFSAIDNDEPQVTVQNIVTYLVPENDANGIAVITEIFADVIDDTPGITYAWTIDPADPGIVFSDTTVVNPTITAYTNGVWTITLTVDDGYWVVPTSAQLRVSRNACAAARYTPGYVGDPIGDITSNCVVDLVDFANLAQSWMEDTNLGAPLYY